MSVHRTALHRALLYSAAAMQFNALPFTKLQYNVMNCTALHLTALSRDMEVANSEGKLMGPKERRQNMQCSKRKSTLYRKTNITI